MGSGYELARAVQKCISAGHRPAEVWRYTPRQLAGWGALIDRERIGRNLELMHLFRSAYGLDRKDYKALVDKMHKNSE